MKWNPLYFSNCMCFRKRKHRLLKSCTYQENGQLEFIIEHHSVNAAGSVEPGCDFIHEVGVEDEEDNAAAWWRRLKDNWEVWIVAECCEKTKWLQTLNIMNWFFCLPSVCGCGLNPNSREKSGPSQSLWQARGKTGSSSARRDSK